MNINGRGRPKAEVFTFGQNLKQAKSDVTHSAETVKWDFGRKPKAKENSVCTAGLNMYMPVMTEYAMYQKLPKFLNVSLLTTSHSNSSH